MQRNTATVLFAIAALVIAALVWQRPSSAGAPEKGTVEYKILPVRELGIVIQPEDAETVFNYEGATDKLNELAADGWTYRDFVPTGWTSAVILERQR